MATLANEWVTRGHEVTLVTLAGLGDDFYVLDSRIGRRTMDLLSPSTSGVSATLANLARLVRLRSTIRSVRPDVVISFLDRTNVRVLLATLGMPLPIVVSERIDPRALPPGRPWVLLRTLTYPRASAIVVQTESVARWANGLRRTPRAVVIPNPVDNAFLSSTLSRTIRSPKIVAVGRLTYQKGFDILIEAFDRFSERWPGWSLTIAGEGPLKGDLAEQIARSRNPNRINLVGRITEIAGLLKDSELFVLSSRFEGFPNVLLEAMASGCAIVATDCPSGPADLIHDGINGRLVPGNDVASLSAAMEDLIADPNCRRTLAERAQSDVVGFAPDVIARRWELLLDVVTSRTAPPGNQVHRCPSGNR